MQKKIFLGGKFHFFKKKRWFFGRFFCFLRPAFGQCRLGHPQSLEYSSYNYDNAASKAANTRYKKVLKQIKDSWKTIFQFLKIIFNWNRNLEAEFPNFNVPLKNLFSFLVAQQLKKYLCLPACLPACLSVSPRFWVPAQNSIHQTSASANLLLAMFWFVCQVLHVVVWNPPSIS